MDTKSTHTQAPTRHSTWRLPRNGTTLPKSAGLLAEEFQAFLAARREGDSLMDKERGQRIRALREERHLSQPAVVESMCKLAKNDKFITLRGYQTWEAGGGISWEKLKVLAKLHAIEPDYILTGENHPAEEAISPAEAEELREQLDRIEKKLDELLKQREPAKKAPRRLRQPTPEADQPKPRSR